MDKIYGEKQSGRVVSWGIILFGILEIGFIRLVYPSYYTHYLLFIPAYFLILGIGVLLVLSHISRKNIHPGRAIARLMMFNVAQIALSFMIPVGYCYFVAVHKRIMLITFLIYYVFFMGLKFYILYNIDKQRKIATK
jgi:hypothetical protein